MPLHPETVAAIASMKKSASGGRIVFVHGNFTIVHPGHLRLLRFASECGDYLVVGVMSDQLFTQGAVVLDEAIRLEGVAAITWVDKAIILRDKPEDVIAALQPAIVVKGREHENQSNAELPILQSYGGQLLFGSGDITFSSLDLIRKERERVNHSSIIRATQFIERHGFSIGELGSILDQMNALKVCVIGDVIVDEYIQCDPLGMSQEDPTIVVTPLVTDQFIGGAGIVAAHAKSLGAKSVDFVSVTGSDATAEYVSEKLAAYGVNAHLVVDESRPTTLKKRYRVGTKTMLRVSHLRQHKIAATLQKKVFDQFMEVVTGSNLVIFSDFNYGVLPQELVNQLTVECQRRGIMTVADSQSSSQVGDISRFRGATLITPTEREARLALGNYDDGLVVVAGRLREKAEADNVVITLGAEGMLVYAKVPSEEGGWRTDRLEALNTAPMDPAGAGDCFLVGSSMALALGRPIWESVYLGSLAAACQVGRIGNAPLSATELAIEMNKDFRRS
jgi:rfaE bifunctional protein kinase chain/domain